MNPAAGPKPRRAGAAGVHPPLPRGRRPATLDVIIVHYRTPDLLRSCLESLSGALAGREEFTRVWVVDNASGDESVPMVRRDFPWVGTIENSDNRGFAAANNQVIEQSHGDYLLLLNPDTEISREAVEALTAFLESEPAAAAVGPRLTDRDGRTQPSAWRFPGVRRAIASWSRLELLLPAFLVHRTGFESPEYLPGNGPRQVDWVSGACLLVRRAAVREVGLLDERFFMYAEETDWCKRFSEAGWTVWQDPKAEVIHLVGGSTGREGSVPLLQAIRFHRSEFRYFEKHRGRPVAAALWCLRLSTAAMNWARWSLQAALWGDSACHARKARFRRSMTALWRVARG